MSWATWCLLACRCQFCSFTIVCNNRLTQKSQFPGYSINLWSNVFHRSRRLRYNFVDLIVTKYEIYKSPKCAPFGYEMFKIASPRPPSRKGLLAFGNRSFAPSALAISSPDRTYSLVGLYPMQLLDRGCVSDTLLLTSMRRLRHCPCLRLKPP